MKTASRIRTPARSVSRAQWMGCFCQTKVMVEAAGVELEPFCGRPSPQAKS